MTLRKSGMIYRVDPVRDSRWRNFLEKHPQATVFHTPEWMQALRSTYGYEPIVFTTSPPGADLTNGIPFCHVKSWITGSRLVSLPFSDHCEPLFEKLEDAQQALNFLVRQMSAENWKYIEFRPRRSELYSTNSFPSFDKSGAYCFHKLNLLPNNDKLYSSFHKNCIQRKIRRAEREELGYEAGRSEKLLDDFYELMLLTRKRHHLPPQPRAWFRNLISCIGENLNIHVAYKGSTPVASILTLLYKDCMVYKFGCSDARFNPLGGTPFLLWKAIQHAKEQGAKEFDMGRSRWENIGLRNFKDHWGASRSTLEYLKCSAKPARVRGRVWKIISEKWLLQKLPDPVIAAVGRLYKHVG